MKLFISKAALIFVALALTGNVNAESHVHIQEKDDSSLQEFLKHLKPIGDFNFRYESVEVDLEGAKTSDGLTLRSRFGVKTADYKGFSALVEFEDVRDIVGIDDKYNRIPDPEVTEVDQAFIQYKADKITTKLGRQVIALSNQRFVGHVGWRQDRQTYDAARVMYSPTENVSLDAAYLYKRNGIFAATADTQARDILFNFGYRTSLGRLGAYYYGLDDKRQGPANAATDTYGGFFGGTTKGDTAFLYHIEFATQAIDIDDGREFDVDYALAEVGLSFNGISLKVGRELLGSDGGNASFSTPLATLHKFNGWSDVTLGGVFNPLALPGGLEDTFLSVGGAFAGIRLAAIYHQFGADVGPASGSGDYGSELNLLAAKNLKGGLVIGAKYAAFADEENNSAFGADVNKFWLWSSFKF